MQIFFQKNTVISKIGFCFYGNNWKLSSTPGYNKAPITGIPEHRSRLLHMSTIASALCQASKKIRVRKYRLKTWQEQYNVLKIFVSCGELERQLHRFLLHVISISFHAAIFSTFRLLPWFSGRFSHLQKASSSLTFSRTPSNLLN